MEKVNSEAKTVAMKKIVVETPSNKRRSPKKSVIDKFQRHYELDYIGNTHIDSNSLVERFGFIH